MSGDNIAQSIDFAPFLPWDWLMALGLLALLFIAFGFWRRGRGTLVRAGLLALLLLALANPVLLSEQRRYLDDVALIVLDQTDSQKINERSETAAKAYDALKNRLQKVEGLKVETVTVKNHVTGPEGEADGSFAFAARDRALENIPPRRIAATIMITDGELHDVPAKDRIDPSGGPVHFLLTGQPDEKDRVLKVVKAPAFGIVNQPLALAIRIEDFGYQERDVATRLTVKLDGDVIQTLPAPIGKDMRLEVTLPHGGANFIEVAADPLSGEITTKNNRAFITVNGVRDRLQVLLVSGEPHMGERGWRNILKSDPSVDLVHFTILRPPEKQDGTPINELSLIPFPIRDLFEKKLNDFDLIIFDRYRRRGVLPSNYLQNIAEYVRNGGALLEAAGPAFASPLSLYQTPLADVLPGRPTGYVFTQGYVPEVSEVGLRHPVTAVLKSSLEPDQHWGRWFRMIEAEATGGETLMTGPEKEPLLLLERKGKGRVAQLLSDHAWLWGRGFEGGGPQAELLRRISHWLMKEPELEEEQLGAVVKGSHLEITRRSLDPAPATVTITDPDGNESTVALSKDETGAQVARAPIALNGLHQLTDGTHKALVAVGTLNSRELHEIRATDEKVKAAAKATGGGIRWLMRDGLPDFRRTKPDNRQSSSYWFGLRANENFEVTGYQRQTMLPPLLSLFLLLAFLGLVWWREGR